MDSLKMAFVTIVVAVCSYTALVLLLRIAGKRVLSKWNAFDLVVTVALGSCLATTILSAQTSLVQGVTAFAVLAFLQVTVTFLSVRSVRFERFVKARPTLLLLRGKFQFAAMKRERVTEEEVRVAVRAKGIADLESVGVVVLETDGSFSVIQEFGPHQNSALLDIEGSGELFN